MDIEKFARVAYWLVGVIGWAFLIYRCFRGF
jgi:hypothetical protein